MKIALVGNPSVGKSLIFQQLTGLGVEVSNYPGTTVEIQSGSVCFKKERIDVVDLPGVYSLEGTGGEEVLVRGFLQRAAQDITVVAVIDASRLERNLYLLLQVAEFQVPMIAVLNMMDMAEASGIGIDLRKLAETLGIEVLGTAALHGKDVEKIIPLAISASRVPTVKVPYDQHIEAAISSLMRMTGSTRYQGLLALQGLGEKGDLAEAAGDITEEIERTHQMTVLQIIAANRHNFAQHLAALATSVRASRAPWDLDRILTRAIPGIPILAAVMVLMLLIVFVAGSFFEGIIVSLCDRYLLIPAAALPLHPLLRVVLTSLLVAVQAGLGIAFPFVFIFAILMALLEDSGYMTRAAFLADRAMHRVGMHGGAIIPLVLSFGCNVPAILATRTLRTRRERIIASFLTTLIPCSARTVIISGIVAAFIGIPQALSIYLIVILITIVTGVVLSRTLPGEQFGMMMELTTLRRPRAAQVFQKSWMRVREFLFIALPLLVAGSLVLGFLSYIGMLALFQEALAPLSMGILGLPSYASTALLFGILRREMAFETLAVLAGTATLNTVLSNTQLYTFALVSTLFVPCISTIAIMRRELGWKIAAAVSVYSIITGIVMGAIVRILFPLVFP